jgi:hypothetical protein
MKKFIFLVLTILSSISSLLTVSSTATCRLPDNCERGKTQNIKRAGVGIIVPLHSNALKCAKLSNYGIIVGHDKNLDRWMIGQAGSQAINWGDISPAQTAARELLEETGGFMIKSADEINLWPYLVAQEKQLFFTKINDLTLAAQIDASVQKAQKNKNLSRCFKEIDTIEIVSLSALLELAQKITSHKLTKFDVQRPRRTAGDYFYPEYYGENYYISSTSGKKILLDGFYMRVFGNQKNSEVYANAHDLFQQLISQ